MLEVKRPGRGLNQPPSSSAPSVPSWQVPGWPLPLQQAVTRRTDFIGFGCQSSTVCPCNDT
jgi:hypothetical protein